MVAMSSDTFVFNPLESDVKRFVVRSKRYLYPVRHGAVLRCDKGHDSESVRFGFDNRNHGFYGIVCGVPSHLCDSPLRGKRIRKIANYMPSAEGLSRGASPINLP